MSESEQKIQKKSNNKTRIVKRKIKQEIIEDTTPKKVTLLVPDEAPELETKKNTKQKKNIEVENSQKNDIKQAKKVNRNFTSEEENENEQNCIQKPHNNKTKTKAKKQNDDSPILFDYNNENENQEKAKTNIKEKKIKKNISKKSVKNKKKNYNLFLSKMRNIITKIESSEKIRKVFFYKWIFFTFNEKNDDNEEEEEENEEEEEVEEEIEEEEEIEKKDEKNIKNYKIPKTEYIVVHQENLNEEEQEENEESDENNNENDNDYLEEIEERAPDEEESAICSVKNKKNFMKFNNQIIKLRKIFRFKNILYNYFKKWKILTKSGKKKTKQKKNNKNQKKNSDNKNLKNILNNDNDQKVKKVKNILKNFIELGGNSTKIQKKFFFLWKENTKKDKKIDKTPVIYKKKPSQSMLKPNPKSETETNNQAESNKQKSSKNTKKKQLPKKKYILEENTNNINPEESDIAKSVDLLNIEKEKIQNKIPHENNNEKPRKLSTKIPIKKNNIIDLTEKIDNICNKHLQNKTERSLSISIPRSKRNSDIYNLDNRRSFSNLNSTMSDEETDNKLLKLIKISSCKKNPLMNSFDKWFDLTYNNKKYTPFIRKKSTNKKKTTTLKTHPKNSNEEKKSEKKTKKIETKAKFLTNEEIKEEPKAKFGDAEIIKPKAKFGNAEDIGSPLLFSDDKKIKDNSKSETSVKKQKKIKDKKNKINENKNNEKNNNDEKNIHISASAVISTSPDLLFSPNNDSKNSNNNKNFSESQNIPTNNNNTNANKIPIKKTKQKKSIPVNEAASEKNINTKENTNISQNRKSNPENQIKNTQIIKKKLCISEESPRQKKPGGKVQFDKNNIEEKKDTIFYENYGKDSSLDLKALANMVFDQEEELSEESPVQSPEKPKKKKHKKNSSTKNNSDKNVKNHKDKKSNKNAVSKNVTNIKNPENENSVDNESNLAKINYFRQDINPDVENIEIYQDDEPEEKKPKKKHKKSKKKDEENNENSLVKTYKRAMHLLRKVIRSYTKRQKQLSTFNPDLEVEKFFKIWFKNIFKNEPKKNVTISNDFITPNIIDNLQEKEVKEKSKKKSKKKSNKDKKSSENKETQKKNKILKIIDILENHRKQYKARLSEDEENVNDKKWCWKKWEINSNSNLDKKEIKKKPNNNMNIEENEEDDDEDNIYEINHVNGNLQNIESEKQVDISEVYINTEKNKTLPYIYNLNKIGNKIKNKTINILTKTPDNLYQNLCPEKFIEILKINNQRINSYRIFSFYSLYNENSLFYIMRKYFNYWRKKIIFSSSLNDKHIKCSNNHCLKCNCEDKEMHCPGCSCDGNVMCLNCDCNKVQIILKQLLIKHKFLKEICPKKYYFNCWMKNKNDKK